MPPPTDDDILQINKTKRELPPHPAHRLLLLIFWFCSHTKSSEQKKTTNIKNKKKNRSSFKAEWNSLNPTYESFSLVYILVSLSRLALLFPLRSVKTKTMTIRKNGKKKFFIEIFDLEGDRIKSNWTQRTVWFGKKICLSSHHL